MRPDIGRTVLLQIDQCIRVGGQGLLGLLRHRDRGRILPQRLIQRNARCLHMLLKIARRRRQILVTSLRGECLHLVDSTMRDRKLGGDLADVVKGNGHADIFERGFDSIERIAGQSIGEGRRQNLGPGEEQCQGQEESGKDGCHSETAMPEQPRSVCSACMLWSSRRTKDALSSGERTGWRCNGIVSAH